MKNEFIEFFNKNSSEIEIIIEDCRQLLVKNRAKDEKSVILLNIINEFLKDGDEKVKEFINQLSKIFEETNLSLLTNFIFEERLNIFDYFASLENEKKENCLKLVDLDWKFIGLTTINKFEVGEIEPKIILRLHFNNGAIKILETDLTNLRKLLDEFDQNLSMLNSTYVRRIDTFLK